MKPIEQMNVAEWHALFKSRTESLSDLTRNAAYVHSAITAINQIKPTLSSAQNNLFELHAHLHILMLLLNLIPDQKGHSGSFIGFHTHAAIADVQLAIAELMQKKSDPADGPGYWQCLEETLAFLRRLMLVESGSKTYFSDPYFWLWQYWIIPNQNDMSLCLEELQQLNAASLKPGSALSRYPFLLAEVWMNFFLQRDEEACSKLKEISSGNELRPSDLFHVLTIMTEKEQWQRLSNWLVETKPYIEKSRINALEIFYSYWDDVIEHIPDAEQLMWAPLIQSLPYASSIYEGKLLRHAKWQQWIDYQLSTGTEPLDYRVGVFAPIEKHAPELLLPFYHQAVERYVLLKNRPGYKTAVKLLKRLAKLYKKRKDEERWETFITAFASNHSRLRALQEELRKGKLIP
ncbi:hypothetical protein BK120_16540 [Paenibacillus sp. FSL A5-0031]|uniref:hypothetical protein n=1 Tax=Paenibacillus sp. FSL A5-0031 TaxID=1920420 RepID=UPI00096D1795|nr:hypothetical protein [Paenibacillus sp. FSL A5-0031]OME82262.1 hypothetical protein BK120_16540 [Paenibacillus sp. FSL A5-0031]